MKIGIYTGSFNPFHEGHQNVLERALKLFDKVIIAVGVNHLKKETTIEDKYINELDRDYRVSVLYFSGLLVDYIKKLEKNGTKCDAVIRGLRNSEDFQYEKTQQYYNEDLGIELPTVYFISDRSVQHISSSGLRQIERIKKVGKNE